MRLILGLGFLSWLIPFTVSFFAYPLKSHQAPLFDNLMAVVLTSTAVLLGLMAVRSAKVSGSGAAGIGFTWWGINIACDLMLFTWGPMAMPTATYLKDIGLAYSAYPIILFGLASAAQWAKAGAEKQTA
jgi:hypothetical protein